ncbi:hypothetical protein [Sinorhizobium meliloti]|uniref:hypothetical protein n=1 Tax=Rhizobium meliloti TaxID=382 RepID=UPI0018659772|nr:hypothetical protein [Sinorhizobium meliloti]
MHYRFVEVEGEEDDLDRVANEWRAKGYELFQPSTRPPTGGCWSSSESPIGPEPLPS